LLKQTEGKKPESQEMNFKPQVFEILVWKNYAIAIGFGTL